MREWKSAPLGKLANAQLGKMLDQKKNVGEYHRYLGNDNVQWGYFKLDDVKEMKLKESELERFRVRPGDLLVCEGGDPGRCALWDSDEEIYYQKALHRVRVGSQLDARFLFYYLLHIGNTQEIRQYYTGGATIKHLPAAALNKVVIRYPTLAIQKRIADVLSAYDKLIENNRRQIKLLEEAAQRLYKEWFVDLRFPGYETTSIVDGLPEGWIWEAVCRIGKIVTGKTPSTKNSAFYRGGTIPFICIPDMKKQIFLLDTEVKLTSVGAESQPEKQIPAGSLLVSCIGTVGLVGITMESCQTNQQINALIPDNESYLYYYYFSLCALKKQLQALGMTGATMLNVSKSKFEQLKILMPTDNVIEKFNNVVAVLFEKIKFCEYQIKFAREARDRLLPKLMSGEIEV